MSTVNDLLKRVFKEESDKDLTEKIGNSLRVSRWISLACLGSSFFYVIIVEILHRIVAFKPIFLKSEHFAIRPVFLGLAIVSILFSTFLQRIAMKSPPKTHDLSKAMNRLTSLHMIFVGIGEQPIIFGFLLYFLEGRYLDFYCLFAVTVILQIRFLPDQMAWVATLLSSGESQDFKE